MAIGIWRAFLTLTMLILLYFNFAGFAWVRPIDGTAMAAMHRVTTDANGRLTIDGRVTAKIDRAALSGHLGAAPSAPAKGTPPCDDWGCTCQGLSDKFGTVVGGWHHAKQVPTAAQFWEAHKCHTFPSGTGKPRPPEPAAAGSMLLKAGGESDPEARNRFKERELFFQAQRERLEAEAAKERQVLATMMKNRVQAASDGPTGDGALAPQRARTEERDDLQLPHGLRAHAPQARVVIATAETRFCLNVANFDRSSRNYATMLKVRNYAAAINLHYAQKHGYEYVMFCEGNMRNMSAAWLKVAAMEWLVERARAQQTPTYILFLDSDAFVRAMDTRLEDWLVTNNVSFPTAPWSLMMSRENKVGTFEVVFDPTILRVQPKLNTGVLYGYVEPAQQDRTERFLAMLRFWQSSTCSQSLCEVFTKEHPWEQGCMEKLVFNASLSSAEKQLLQSVHVSQQPMNLWNGPWGIFVRHVWAGPGVEKREDMFTDMIDSYDIDVPTSLATIKADMLAPSISSTRSCNEQGEAMERAEAPSPQASLPKSRIQSGTSGSRSDVPRVPFPDGVATSGGSAKGRSKIRPECLTIVQTSNFVDWEGVNGTSLAEVAVETPGKVSKILGLVQMYLYAKRHGHGYRVVVIEENSVTMGSGRPRRHPAWARVPLLQLLYSGGIGADLVLDRPLSGATCPTDDRWVLYLDTDVVVTATGFDVGEIIEALRTTDQHHSGIPCQKVYKDPTFANREFMAVADNKTGFCHHSRDLLKTSLALGVDPTTDIAFAGFNDVYSDVQDCGALGNAKSPKCPSPAKNGMCTAIMLWRVPAPKVAVSGTFDDPAVARAIRAGKEMVNAWVKPRLAPGGDDKEDFLAMGWSEEAPTRLQEVFREMDESKCSVAGCGFASDQGVFNRAVLYGLPHRPWHADYPGNTQIGRFIKHISILKCEACAKDGSYIAGEPFFHGTAWKEKKNHLIAWMMKLSYELHGLHYIFPFTAGATAKKQPTPADAKMVATVPRINHPDAVIRTDLNRRLEQVCHADTAAARQGCAIEHDMVHSAAVVNKAIAAIKTTVQLKMRLNPKFKGVDAVPEADDEKDWYQVFR